jgi:two-component system nitrogen regulation sensor histidine kinase GlnL
MSKASAVAKRTDARPMAVDAWAVLSALPDPVLVVNEKGRLIYANAAAEQFFDTSAATLLGGPLEQLLPQDSPVFALISPWRRRASARMS